MILIDANVILRYLLNDHPQLSQQAAQIIDNQSVSAPIEVICEVVYVLYKVYQIPKKEIQQQISSLLDENLITVDKPEVVQYALLSFANDNIDIVDAILLAYCVIENKSVLTFDKKLNRCLDKNKKL